MIDPRNGPHHDLPGTDGPRRVYAIASTPRTGSTLLCRALWTLGLGAPKEYLNGMQIRDWECRGAPSRSGRLTHRLLQGPLAAGAGRGWWSDRRLAAYLARVQAHRTSAAGWFGLKLHWHHYERWFERPGRRPETCFGPVRWIRLRRDDRVAQAVSWARARQTGRWSAEERALAPARIRQAQITARLAAIEAAESGWNRTLPGDTLALSYEDLVTDWTGALGRVLAWLGEPPPAGPLPAPAQRRQADARSVAWIAGYRTATARH